MRKTVEYTGIFDCFELQIEAEFDVYNDTYGEDADGNRGIDVVCADLLYAMFTINVTDEETFYKEYEDVWKEVEESKLEIIEKAREMAIEKYQ